MSVQRKEELQKLINIKDSLLQGSLSLVTEDNKIYINNLVMHLLNTQELNEEDLQVIELILSISNILYNNTDKELLILEDGVYDILLELYKSYNNHYQVGAEPVTFSNTNEESIKQELSINPIKFLDIDKINQLEYKLELLTQAAITKEDLLVDPLIIHPKNLKRKTLNTTHKYPKLVGTLDKTKFVLNIQAKEKGVFDDNNVKILERDFFAKHIKEGIIDPYRDFYIILELKYDGVSVEAEVSNKILNARQRGDAVQDLAADVSNILRGYRFLHAVDTIPDDNIFGMKFEAIMTYMNLCRYNELKGKEYKNCRTAISSIFNSLDGYKYRDLITLVPLETSMDIDRLTEVEFMNKYYHSGELLRYAVIHGNYQQILFQIKAFVEEAEYLREFMPFMYDGVVLSYIEPDIIDKLGRSNAVNKYSIAVKFNPLKKLTHFRGYTFSVGQNGIITPMIYFDPIEFYGTVHDHSSGHSYDRFKKLELRLNDIIEVEYVNDVMPYITKPTNDHNDNNSNPILEFITECPSCGTELEISKSGKSIICPNIKCPERNINRMVSLMDKLNLKDFSEAYLTQIAALSLKQLLSLTREDVLVLGEVNSQKFIDRMNQIKTENIYDYRLIGSLGFTDIAIEKWKLILNKFSLQEILSMNEEQLYENLINIKGIGPTTVETICNEMDFFKDDLYIILNMSNIIISKGMKASKSIRFTGFRDKELTKKLQDMGYDCSDTAGVTQSTDILLVPSANHTSSKTKKTGPNTLIVPISEFLANMEAYL